MSDYPLPANEKDRIAALRSYHIFDTGEDFEYDAITSLASAICQIPIALITFIDEERQWFKSHHGTDITENKREYSFCTHTIAYTNDILVVPDASADDRFSSNPMVTGPTRVTFYAGVPLINKEGYALGTLCVIDQKTHNLSDIQVEALKTLAKQVVDKVELRKKIASLQQINQQLMNSNVLIRKFASMAAHDIKNPLSSILLTSQALNRRHLELQDESGLRLAAMNIEATRNLLLLVDEMLAYSKNPALLLNKKQDFEIRSMLEKLIAMIVVPENISLILPEEGHYINMSAVAFEQIFINLLTNAIRYNDKDKGIVKISFKYDEHNYHFEVSDNGPGIAEQYHDKIFEDNYTLNISDRNNEKGSGIGLSTVKDLIIAIQGEIHLKSAPGCGASFHISIRKS